MLEITTIINVCLCKKCKKKKKTWHWSKFNSRRANIGIKTFMQHSMQRIVVYFTSNACLICCSCQNFFACLFLVCYNFHEHLGKAKMCPEHGHLFIEVKRVCQSANLFKYFFFLMHMLSILCALFIKKFYSCAVLSFFH